MRADVSLNEFELPFNQSLVQELDTTFIKRIKCIDDFKIMPREKFGFDMEKQSLNNRLQGLTKETCAAD